MMRNFLVLLCGKTAIILKLCRFISIIEHTNRKIIIKIIIGPKQQQYCGSSIITRDVIHWPRPHMQLLKPHNLMTCDALCVAPIMHAPCVVETAQLLYTSDTNRCCSPTAAAAVVGQRRKRRTLLDSGQVTWRPGHLMKILDDRTMGEAEVMTMIRASHMQTPQSYTGRRG